MIDSMFQEGTDTAIRDQIHRPTTGPRPGPKFRFGDLLSAPAQGTGGAASEGIAFGAEILGAFGSVAGAYPEILGPTQLTDQQRQEAEQARRKLLDAGPAYSNEAGDIFRARAAEIMPDPQTTHSSAVVVAGVSKFAAKAVGYALTTGPAAPVALGGDEAFTEADKLKQAGVDLPTRAAAGAVAGVVAGGSIVLPVVGATAAKTAALVVAGGPGGFIAQNAAERAILEHGGYRDLASNYDPFDPVGLALSTLVPAAFGAHGYRSRGTPKVLPDLKSEAQAKEAMKLTPEEQARGDAYDLTPENLAELQREIGRTTKPEDRATLQAEFDRLQQRSSRETVREIVRNEPDAEPAARVRQVADAIDELRLTRDGDAAGAQAHLTALELAHEQIAAGERVEVSNVLSTRDIDSSPRAQEMQAPPESIVDKNGASYRVEIHRETLGAAKDTEGVFVQVFDPVTGDRRARIDFAVNSDGTLAAENTNVAPTFRRLGIAQAMYQAALDTGYKIVPGRKQTELGAKMLAGLQEKGVIGLSSAEPAFKNRTSQQLGKLAHSVEEVRMMNRVTEPAHAIQEAPQKPSQTSGEAPSTTAPAAAERTSLDHSIDQVVEANPDLMVQLDGMDKPMRIGDLLERVREEAKEDKQEGDFVRAAVACFLRSGG